MNRFKMQEHDHIREQMERIRLDLVQLHNFLRSSPSSYTSTYNANLLYIISQQCNKMLDTFRQQGKDIPCIDTVMDETMDSAEPDAFSTKKRKREY